ncbi:porin [Chondrinema litorale]|uniref:porin n=1 Tax=Chondrinema litorale TaxID=2994555 RepID=UPI00254384A1|nr:porin [Chondrinema litorale]UZR95995.1 porin [Chondrinema litorale]
MYNSAKCILSRESNSSLLFVKFLRKDLAISCSKTCTNFIKIFLSLTFLISIDANAQLDSLLSGFKAYGGIDVYYSYGFNDPASGNRPGFLYSHTKTNAINVNTAYLGLAYEKNLVRGNFALVAGDYAVSNYAAEEQLFQNVLEANVGFKIKDGLWLDAGIFPSHIGIEGAIGPNNPNLTRSLVAHNSPFYESGVKLSYQINDKWFASFLVLNGWQNIKENNDNKALATQVTFTPNSTLTFNSSSFFGEGNNTPDGVESFRIFHNLYVIWQPSEKLYTALAFDIGSDKLETRNNGDFTSWWGTVFLINYSLSNYWKVTGRLEHFNDPDRVIMNIYPVEHKISSVSAGLDYSPVSNAFFRIEGKLLTASENLFEKDQDDESVRGSENFAITASIGVNF